jgi:hypothetical protein
LLNTKKQVSLTLTKNRTKLVSTQISKHVAAQGGVIFI